MNRRVPYHHHLFLSVGQSLYSCCLHLVFSFRHFVFNPLSTTGIFPRFMTRPAEEREHQHEQRDAAQTDEAREKYRESVGVKAVVFLNGALPTPILPYPWLVALSYYGQGNRPFFFFFLFFAPSFIFNFPLNLYVSLVCSL